ncbi:MAG: glycosyltransferase, partial [Rhodospirillaceae bacterium]|nr:glycosyltransferase [Rhodospirillaceae bacterium]
VFPNRAEGGTNLVAMECMACGVPAILSENTGHRDLLTRPGAALPLCTQGVVKGGSHDHSDLFLDWGESDPDEIVAHLEWAYANRAAATDVGTAGAAFLREWAWPEKVDALFAALGWA